MGSARFSANGTERIGCERISSENGVPEATIFCSARNASGLATACVTSDPGLADVVKGLTYYSGIIFTWRSDGTCEVIHVLVNSRFIPRHE
jgi:hypothetical protein